ncbi:MAG: 50S ribosomal protein L17 [Fuerstiella sp.]|nr:50S ribosomal protein L17 [Fuerstiella sp.]
MRHRMRGRKLGRNASHRKAMFRNMATSLIRSVRVDEDDPQRPRVPGRIVTTVAKAKELRPFVEKLVTIARRAIAHEEAAAEYQVNADRNTDEWRTWRQSEQWQQWANTIAPAVALRRRAFSMLRDTEAVDVLFDELAERFEDRPGGYTRIVRLAKVRLGDAGQQALIEFVGERDRVRSRRRAAPVITEAVATESATESEPSAVEKDAGAQESNEEQS